MKEIILRVPAAKAEDQASHFYANYQVVMLNQREVEGGEVEFKALVIG